MQYIARRGDDPCPAVPPHAPCFAALAECEFDGNTPMNTRLSLLSMTLLAVCLSASAQDDKPLIPDKNLEAAVRRSVFEKRDNDKPLTAEDLEKISTITGRGKGIKSLQGLEHCRALAELVLPDNEIGDLSPLKDLKELQTATLSNNKIKDLKPLETVTALQYLELSGNEIENLAPLEKLSNMRSLYLSKNKVKDLKPVAKLEKLWSLYLDGNQVSDLKPLAKLPWLSDLDLTGNKVADLAPLKEHDELRHLILNGNQVKDLGVLLEMAKKDVEGSRRFAPFWNVYLDGNPLSDDAKKQIEELKKLGVRIHLKE